MPIYNSIEKSKKKQALNLQFLKRKIYGFFNQKCGRIFPYSRKSYKKQLLKGFFIPNPINIFINISLTIFNPMLKEKVLLTDDVKAVKRLWSVLWTVFLRNNRKSYNFLTI